MEKRLKRKMILVLKKKTLDVEHIDKYISEIGEEHSKLWLNLSSLLDHGAYMVGPDCPGDRVWRMFTRLGMRHIVVVDHAHSSEPIGIITRKDIIAASKGYIQD